MAEKQQTPGPTEQAQRPRILVVASDPQLRKWLAMSLSLEFACEIHTTDSADKAEAVATHHPPALLIVDEPFPASNAADLAARLHRIAGLEQLPILLLTVSDLSQNGHQGYPTRFLEPSWNVAPLYAAVQALLAETL